MIQITAYLIKGLNDIQSKIVTVDDKNYILVRKRLEYEKERALMILKDLKEKERIKSISRPRNFAIQKELNKLVKVKKEINKSIQKIKEVFYIV